MRSVLGTPVARAATLKSGIERVELADGRTVLVKSGASAAEAAGLRWLRIDGGPLVPEVLEFDGNLLVTEFVPHGSPGENAAAVLGRGLAAMHRAGAPAFGAPPPGGPTDAWIGMAPMRNAPSPSWPQWYVTDRVLPYLRKARLRDSAVDRVCERIDELAGPPEPPARLHGDLWSGNVLWSGDGAWLVDPAAHGGHRETDLAMLALFGCPHLSTVLAAYDEAYPLAEGWRRRVALHQLFPLLVHTVLFGGGYAEQTIAAARAALRGT